MPLHGAALPRSIARLSASASSQSVLGGLQHRYRRISKVVRKSRQLLNEIGREPTPEELAEKLGMPLEKVRKVLKIAKEPLSLETPIGDEEEFPPRRFHRGQERDPADRRCDSIQFARAHPPHPRLTHPP